MKTKTTEITKEMKRLAAMVISGMNYRKIGKKIGRSNTYVYYRIKEYEEITGKKIAIDNKTAIRMKCGGIIESGKYLIKTGKRDRWIDLEILFKFLKIHGYKKTANKYKISTVTVWNIKNRVKKEIAEGYLQIKI